MSWPGAEREVFKVRFHLATPPLGSAALRLLRLLPEPFLPRFSAWRASTQLLSPGFYVTALKSWTPQGLVLCSVLPQNLVHIRNTQQPGW